MNEITEDDLRKLIDQLCPAPKPMMLLTGKAFVREFARQWFGGSYTFSQLMSLFRGGIITPQDGLYLIRG